MSSNECSQSCGGPNATASVAEIGASLAGRASAARKRGNIYLGVGAVLSLAMIIYCVSLTRMAFKLDAEALAEIGRSQLEQSLPNSRAELGAHLREAAPQLVSQLLDSVIEGTAHVRPLLLDGLEGRLDALTQGLETALDEQLRQSVLQHKANLDLLGSDLTEQEKVEALVKHVCETFETQFAQAVTELHPQFVTEIERVRGRVSRLATTPEGELTAKEKIQRDIIQIMLRLAMLEQSQLPGTSS